MDQITLVREQIEDGEKFLMELTRNGFPITIAGWLYAEDDGQWFLYIASPTVDKLGDRESYRRMHVLIRKITPLALDPFEIKLFGASEPLARDMAAVRDRSPGRRTTWYRGGTLGNRSFDAGYLYASVKAPDVADEPSSPK